MAKVKRFVKTLNKSKQVKVILEKKEQKPIYADPLVPLPKEISFYLHKNGIERLYSHQVQTLERARAGKNVALVTSTASGKTLAFTLPVFEKLLTDKKATVLFLYPMKALAYDQLKEIKDMEKGIGENFHSAVYDGDTPKNERRNIRQYSRIIISNPHALHRYLSWHRLWQNFFTNLSYIVIDEAHWYRGVYGTNVAFLMRRIKRVLDFYNSSPRFILSSATMADPLEHAYKLTGEDFSLVNEDGSGKGKKYYIFWDTAKNPDRSQHMQTSDLLAGCVENDLQTLCFTGSRKMAELTAMWAERKTKGVASYRAGYLASDRRELEKKLKEGKLKGIASTNALELGINIGGLDSVIIGGYPGTVSSFHQRAGRSGRSGQESLVVQLLYDNPIDSYLLAQPDFVFKEPSEQAVISLDNKNIIKNHVLCGAEELPLIKEDEEYFTENYAPIVKELIKSTEIKRLESSHLMKSTSNKQYKYNGKGASFTVSLSSFDSDDFELDYKGKTLEILNRRQAYTEAHPGAVFWHKAKPYKVLNFDYSQKKIFIDRLDEEYFTSPLMDTGIDINKIYKSKEYKNLRLHYGEATVTESVHGFVKKSFKKSLERIKIDLPAVVYNTKAVWVENSLAGIKGDRAGGIHGAEHALIAVTPLLAMCDRWDIGGISSLGENKIYIYDGFPGGIGIAERLYEKYHDLVDKAVEVVQNCQCEKGCPRCILSPKCGNNNDPLDKKVTLKILQLFQDKLS